MSAPSSERRAHLFLLAATVGIVLADSSVVTLALPEILRRFDTTVFGVSWVLTVFNIVLAAAILPAARVARKDPRGTWGAGLVTFAAASLACALAPSLTVLIVARCVQALGGAAVVAGAIELIARGGGSHQLAAPLWGGAALIGLAVGPAAGGALTEILSWQAIFAVQVPVLLALPAGIRREPGPTIEPMAGGKLDLAPEVALGLLSAALTGALFLLVIMLTEGWGHSPLAAALVVSVLPLATLVAGAFRQRGRAVTAAGAVLMGGGLAALGLVPGAGSGWTLVPQALIGVGLALALPELTERALAGRDPRGRRAAGTIAARHAGVVIGLVILTPVFSAELKDQERAAQRSGTALLLDADLATSTKIDLGTAIADRIGHAGGRLPRLGPAFAEVGPQPGSRSELDQLERRLEDEIEKAATAAFSLSFIIAGALALLALIPILWPRAGVSAGPLVVSSGAAAALIAVYLALGGATYKPLHVADPCHPRPTDQLRERKGKAERLALSGLDGAACRLRVTREELALALATPDSRAAFARKHEVGEAQIDAALRAGLERAVQDAKDVGDVSAIEAALLREAIKRLPTRLLIKALQTGPGKSLLTRLTELLDERAR